MKAGTLNKEYLSLLFMFIIYVLSYMQLDFIIRFVIQLEIMQNLRLK